ncbi:MAG: signal peptide peptidase SppA [Planctomycetaceae bacterium]|nr:signal peptide peptidase SppA [Planctomycetaceae bacterium]
MSTTPPVPAPQRRRGCLIPLLAVGLFLSVLLNLVALYAFVEVIDDSLEPNPTSERFYLGDPDSRYKIAVIRVSGVLTEAGIQQPIRQLEAAARDKRVKAVVLRIDSPGGTVTASEELYQNILNLRDNNGRRFKSTSAKPVSVSMGGVAASGAYYISVAGNPISAEKSTITGSIGVFVALPNIAELAHKNGVKLELIKAGGIKASGSFFHDLSPQERQTWQDTVDSAYDQFVGVIAANRPALNANDLRDKVVLERMIPERDEKGNPKTDAAGKVIEAKYTRRLADGGTFTASAAQQFGLVDRVEDLPAAIRAAAEKNGLGSFKAIVYERTPGILERVTGLPLGKRSVLPVDLLEASSSLTPRLWYLAPSADAGLLAGH